MLTAAGFLFWTHMKAPVPEGDWQTGECPVEDTELGARAHGVPGAQAAQKL